MGTQTDEPNVRAKARSRTFFENPVVVSTVLSISFLTVLIFGWFVLFRQDASTQINQPEIVTAAPTDEAAIVVKRDASTTVVPTQQNQQDVTLEQPEPEFFTVPYKEPARMSNVLAITNLASGMTVRRASAAQIDVEFPELVGVPKMSVEDLEGAIAQLDVLLNVVNMSQSTDDPNKLAIEQAAWYIRQHISDDMALHAFYAGFMTNAYNREFAARYALANNALPEELSAQADAVVRASHEVEAAMVFLNPISDQGRYIELDQTLFFESSALLTNLRNLHVELAHAARPAQAIAEVPQALPTAMPNELPSSSSQPFPNIDPRSVPRTKPLPSALGAPINLNTPAKASTVFEEGEAQLQVCEGPILLNGEVVVGAMPVNLVNWFVWGKSHLGGSAYTRPMYKVVKVIPYEAAPVELINQSPIVVDFPVVEYIMEKTLGEGPGVVSFYVTDEGHRKLTELGVVEGRLVEFTTILGLIGP